MLNRIEWDKPKVQADVFSLESLIAWLETMPAHGNYRYLCNGSCLLAQYFTAAGFENVHMWSAGFWHGPLKCPRSVGESEARRMGRLTQFHAVFNRIAERSPFTFGAALARARKAAQAS